MAFSAKFLLLLLAISFLNIANIQASFWNRVPFVSQVKSIIQVAKGDADGARKTQDEFLSTPLHPYMLLYPITKSTIHGFRDEHEAARNTWKRVVNIHGTHWTKLQFREGDILECRINYIADHVMLATSSDSVAHMKGSKATDTGRLIEESWEEYHDGEGDKQTNCRVSGKTSSPDQAVSRAREDIERFQGRSIYYNLLRCNCEHWVNRWTKGLTTSFQSLLPPDSSCDA